MGVAGFSFVLCSIVLCSIIKVVRLEVAWKLL